MYRKLVYLFAVGLMLAATGGVQAQEGEGPVLAEYWDGIGGVMVDDNLRTDCRFPAAPDESVYLDRMASPSPGGWEAATRSVTVTASPQWGQTALWPASSCRTPKRPSQFGQTT